MRGTVTEFDESAGLGTVRSEHGRDYPFHCTAVVDGSRTAAVGSDVMFEVVAGNLGRWEATRIQAL